MNDKSKMGVKVNIEDGRQRLGFRVGNGPYRCSYWTTEIIGEADSMREAARKWRERHGSGAPYEQVTFAFDEVTKKWWANYLVCSG